MVYVKSVSRLEFEEKPDYDAYRHLFLDLLSRHQIENDSIFDWMIPVKERVRYLKELRKKFSIMPSDPALVTPNDDSDQQPLNDHLNDWGSDAHHEAVQDLGSGPGIGIGALAGVGIGPSALESELNHPKYTEEGGQISDFYGGSSGGFDPN